LPELATDDSAEALFDALDVPCDPRVLAVVRLHVLRRFGLASAAVDAEPGLSAAERRARRREALAAPNALDGAPLVRLRRRR
jgi:nitrogenase-stabilizing/protective protein